MRFALLLWLFSATAVPFAATAADGGLLHVVQRGETLWEIGRRYGVPVEELVQLNELSDPNRLVVGQKLIIREGEGRVHIVQPGDNLTRIARLYGVRVQDLIALNGLTDPDRLAVGQRLIVTPRVQRTHVVAAGDTLWDIARRYEVSVDAIASANGIADPALLRIGQKLVIPAIGGGDGPAVPVLVRAAEQRVSLVWPLQGRITSRFGMRWGRMHHGMDIAAPIGTPVQAAAAGTVTYSGWAGSYGMLVTIEHGNGVETRYAHLSRTLVKAGDRVQKGQRIALVGSTGNSTGPHLHFEVLIDGEPRDPADWLPGGK
ncbi:MAG: LysM peptidoglycan-binding domain-containing M23 family metallopeptidase [Firmicutes bacterium]|nr:LysM peptidoglycan-binding domain-containing M23 family metallopeptidase [Bacillota bacterium]